MSKVAELNRDVAGYHLQRRVYYVMDNEFNDYKVNTTFFINGRCFEQYKSYKTKPTLEKLTEDFVKEFEHNVSMQKKFWNDIHFKELNDE